MFRTSVGFYDAYVAASSRAAALRAWGSDTDLFAMGAAEVVLDEKLAAGPLAEPGTVFKTPRGTPIEHLAALANDSKPATTKPSKTSAKDPKPARIKPRPSRKKLDDAEQALTAAEQDHTSELATLTEEIDRLTTQRDELQERHEARQSQLQRAVDAARNAYDAALAKWRRD